MPFPITMRSCVGEFFRRVYDSLANSTEFQAFVGESSVAGAEAKIYLFETPERADISRDAYTEPEWLAMHPCAIIEPPDDNNIFEFNSIATGGYYAKQLAASVQFQRILDPGETRANTELAADMIDRVGVIVEEMMDESSSQGRLAFTDVLSDVPVWRAPMRDRTALGDMQTWMITLAVQEST